MSERESDLRIASAATAVKAPPAVAPAGGTAALHLQRQYGNALLQRLLDTGGTPLPSAVRADMEQRFDRDFGAVRMHTGPDAALLNRVMGASALTSGADIFFGAGAYAPDSPAGRQLLAHELAHVVQQAGGPVTGVALGGVLVSDPFDRFEHDADRTAGAVLAGEGTRNAGPRAAVERRPGGPVAVQRKSRASETDDLLEWWDSDSDAQQALALLGSMTPVDFDDTLGDMLTSSQFGRLAFRLPKRADIVRFLQLIARNASPARRDAAMAAFPLANMSAENQLIVYGYRFQSGYGARGAAPAPGLAATLVSSNPSAPFTGSGATGVSPRDAPLGLIEMWRMRSQAKEAVERFGPGGVERAQYTKEPGLEMLYDWSNPNKGSLVGPGSWLETLTATTREQQVKLLLGREITTHSRGAYGATLPSRIQVVRAAAAAQRLEPELVAAIILAEQRDQSTREDAADYRSAAMAGRSSSIGLGQVTVTTARKESLFADLLSPSMQRWLSTATPTTTTTIAGLLSSDEFNIFAVARYLRIVADRGAVLSIAALPRTTAWVGAIDMARYAGNSSTWTEEHVKLIGSEYTSKPWDDVLVPGWGDFVLEAYRDVKLAAVF